MRYTNKDPNNDHKSFTVRLNIPLPARLLMGFGLLIVAAMVFFVFDKQQTDEWVQREEGFIEHPLASAESGQWSLDLADSHIVWERVYDRNDESRDIPFTPSTEYLQEGDVVRGTYHLAVNIDPAKFAAEHVKLEVVQVATSEGQISDDDGYDFLDFSVSFDKGHPSRKDVYDEEMFIWIAWPTGIPGPATPGPIDLGMFAVELVADISAELGN